jgi:threonine aldolase
MFPTEANTVFLKLPPALADALRQRGWQFSTFIGGGARFMFAWDAQPDRVQQLADDIGKLAAATAPS